MNKKTLLYCIEWVVALAACGWLVWKLATYDEYSSLTSALQTMGWQHWIAIGVCVALMPVNMALEAWRWKTLIPMSWREAHRQVYYSKLAGLITPWRLGEYPARALLMSQEESQESVWSKVLSMGVVGSATMTLAIVIAGVIGLAFSPKVIALLGGSYLYSLCTVILVLLLVLALAPKALKRFAPVNQDLILRSTGQSLVRLGCWCVQLALGLYALGAILDFKLLILNLPIYYLLVTVTPSVPIAEVGVRGAWAIALFGTVNAGLAGVLLWVINTLLPCLSWFFLRKKT